MDIVIATRNRKKAEEIKRIIGEELAKDSSRSADIRIFTLNDFPDCPEVIEDAGTIKGNAIKKALTVAKHIGMTALADDSGIEVYTLDGRPGVLSSRYAGADADDIKNVEKLLNEMRCVDDDKRGARFVCTVALSSPEGCVITFDGYIEGRIGKYPMGSGGFGYDPVFYPEGHTKTFAEIPDDEKDAISHRGKALRECFQYVNRHI